jgi:hypothetical protein
MYYTSGRFAPTSSRKKERKKRKKRNAPSPPPPPHTHTQTDTTDKLTHTHTNTHTHTHTHTRLNAQRTTCKDSEKKALPMTEETKMPPPLFIAVTYTGEITAIA